MDIFVNREAELQLIDESFTALSGQKRLLRNPIIEVQGVSGIGKTSLLKQIEQRCRKAQLRYLWIDVRQNPINVSHEIIVQVKKYIHNIENEFEQSPVHATKILLDQGPVVMLFDAIDSAYEKQLHMIESLLQDLIDDERLFVVLTSKKLLPFQAERSVARKLTTLSLQPLNRRHCYFYLDKSSNQTDPKIRNLIFEWTHGYPLAMHVMTQAVNQGLNPLTEQGQKGILALLTERVINQEVLATIKPDEQNRYLTLLQLLAVPRRFNLIIMQNLIETFNPEQKKENSMAYFGLPLEINDATGLLSWNLTRSGFAIDEPIRSIFLLLLKAEQPERYFAIHEFLAQAYLRLAIDFSGSDRVRHIRESLYHLASNTSIPSLPERLTQPMQIILQEPPDIFLRFAQEFAQDNELQDALGDSLVTIQATIDTRLQETKNDDTSEG